MKLRAVFLICLVASSILSIAAAAALAQEGHPLTGVWYGDWGPNAATRNQITIIMNWDGKSVTGQFNPGPDAMTLKAATLDSTKWTVHFEVEGKDDQGKAVHYVADGKLENIGSYNRTITGTWNDGTATKNDFKLKRD